ncbi:sigma-70 family RNA polymerase sigma factor [Nonomuraea sp. NPDC052116]|uniref:RNA polymerase sigma factor n=1 Tax=Nonomuraea sp. NPDC052116 TaxID=3155665 RepID=UPI00341DFD41
MVQLNKSTARVAAPPGADLGSRGQVEHFFRGHYRLLMKVAAMAGATEQEADEAVGMTMIDLWRRWPEIDHPKAYACRAVVSNFIKRRKQDAKETERLLGTQAPVTEADGDARMTLWEDREWVEQMLDRLPPAQREVMTYYLEGLKAPEIAGYLDKRPDAIRKNLQFARERLKEIIEQERCIQTTVTHMAPQTREEEAL